MIMEDVIELMRRDIFVQIPRSRDGEPGSFTVGVHLRSLPARPCR